MKAILIGAGSHILGSTIHLVGRLASRNVEIINANHPELPVEEQIKTAIEEHPDAIIMVEGTAQSMLDEMAFPRMKDITFTLNNFKMEEIDPPKKEKSYSKYQKGRDKRNK